ncbi:choline dehydrogenase [Strigomonas culicis]|uniref:Choline dehydrogenase n=1 Tax=Strigomonas culicis TaxID=28005 RepID=S9TT86_9TRYP|nr:choline dehydrogenase [Strigomonas culicis]|eukprot:EPY19794.1 choline dehydrogenase [Strigomonas culicis]
MKASYDVVVLGAGAAGCAAARAIASTNPNASVALVEQGPRAAAPSLMGVPLLQPYIPYMRKARPYLRLAAGVAEDNLGGRALTYVRGQGLGGSALCNTMQYVRPTAADMQAWGDDQWRFAALLPFFKALEGNTRGASDAHNDRGPLCVSDPGRSNVDSSINVRFFEACEAAGIAYTADFNAGAACGFSSCQSLVRRGVRVDVFGALLEREQHRMPNLSVVTGTRAERLLFDGPRARGVRCVSGATARDVAAQEVVLCLGALESPGCYCAAGSVPGRGGGPAGVAATSSKARRWDLVFRIQNSAGVCSKSLSLRNAGYLWRQWREYAEDHTGIFAALTEGLAFVQSRDTAGVAADLSVALYRTPHMGAAVRRPMDGLTLRLTHHYPRSRGEVRLDPASGAVRVRSGLLTSREDVVAMDEGVQWVGLLTSNELRSVYYQTPSDRFVSPFHSYSLLLAHPARGLQTQRDTAAFLARHVVPGGDLYGTCALGRVVDPRLRVRGLEGVRVADSSVVPQPTVASSAVLGAAIGARVVDLL